MTFCVSCGAENADGTQFCVRCGATLAPAPAPESWKVSGDLGTPAAPPSDPSGGYTPGGAAGGYGQPSSGYPSYNPSQTPMPYQQPLGGAQPMHPAVPALVSFFLPGLGLLFMKDKQGPALAFFGGYIAYWLVSFVLSFVFIGFCLFLLFPLLHIAAGIYTWDEAAKQSNGQFQPILFK